MKELSSAFMKKHLRLFNKMVRAETYKDIAKMNAKQVREVFKRDFRETVSGKDGKTFYSPRKYEIDLDTGDNFVSEFKKLSTDKPKSKPKKKAEPKKAEPKKAETKKKPLLAYEKAWAVGNANASQRVLIAKMTDKRKKEVLKQLKEEVKKIVTK